MKKCERMHQVIPLIFLLFATSTEAAVRRPTYTVINVHGNTLKSPALVPLLSPITWICEYSEQNFTPYGLTSAYEYHVTLRVSQSDVINCKFTRTANGVISKSGQAYSPSGLTVLDYLCQRNAVQFKFHFHTSLESLLHCRVHNSRMELSAESTRFLFIQGGKLLNPIIKVTNRHGKILNSKSQVPYKSQVTLTCTFYKRGLEPENLRDFQLYYLTFQTAEKSATTWSNQIRCEYKYQGHPGWGGSEVVLSNSSIASLSTSCNESRASAQFVVQLKTNTSITSSCELKNPFIKDRKSRSLPFVFTPVQALQQPQQMVKNWIETVLPSGSEMPRQSQILYECNFQQLGAWQGVLDMSNYSVSILSKPLEHAAAWNLQIECRFLYRSGHWHVENSLEEQSDIGTNYNPFCKQMEMRVGFYSILAADYKLELKCLLNHLQVGETSDSAHFTLTPIPALVKPTLTATIKNGGILQSPTEALVNSEVTWTCNYSVKSDNLSCYQVIIDVQPSEQSWEAKVKCRFCTRNNKWSVERREVKNKTGTSISAVCDPADNQVQYTVLLINKTEQEYRCQVQYEDRNYNTPSEQFSLRVKYVKTPTLIVTNEYGTVLESPSRVLMGTNVVFTCQFMKLEAYSQIYDLYRVSLLSEEPTSMSWEREIDCIYIYYSKPPKLNSAANAYRPSTAFGVTPKCDAENFFARFNGALQSDSRTKFACDFQYLTGSDGSTSPSFQLFHVSHVVKPKLTVTDDLETKLQSPTQVNVNTSITLTCEYEELPVVSDSDIYEVILKSEDVDGANWAEEIICRFSLFNETWKGEAIVIENRTITSVSTDCNREKKYAMFVVGLQSNINKTFNCEIRYDENFLFNESEPFSVLVSTPTTPTAHNKLTFAEPSIQKSMKFSTTLTGPQISVTQKELSTTSFKSPTSILDPHTSVSTVMTLKLSATNDTGSALKSTSKVKIASKITWTCRFSELERDTTNVVSLQTEDLKTSKWSDEMMCVFNFEQGVWKERERLINNRTVVGHSTICLKSKGYAKFAILLTSDSRTTYRCSLRNEKSTEIHISPSFLIQPVLTLMAPTLTMVDMEGKVLKSPAKVPAREEVAFNCSFDQLSHFNTRALYTVTLQKELPSGEWKKVMECEFKYNMVQWSTEDKFSSEEGVTYTKCDRIKRYTTCAIAIQPSEKASYKCVVYDFIRKDGLFSQVVGIQGSDENDVIVTNPERISAGSTIDKKPMWILLTIFVSSIS